MIRLPHRGQSTDAAVVSEDLLAWPYKYALTELLWFMDALHFLFQQVVMHGMLLSLLLVVRALALNVGPEYHHPIEGK